MPALSNKTVPLLRTVGGRPHARDDDHEGPAPRATRASMSKTPNKSFASLNESFDHEPESSGDSDGARNTGDIVSSYCRGKTRSKVAETTEPSTNHSAKTKEMNNKPGIKKTAFALTKITDENGEFAEKAAGAMTRTRARFRPPLQGSEVEEIFSQNENKRKRKSKSFQMPEKTYASSQPESKTASPSFRKPPTFANEFRSPSFRKVYPTPRSSDDIDLSSQPNLDNDDSDSLAGVDEHADCRPEEAVFPGSSAPDRLSANKNGMAKRKTKRTAVDLVSSQGPSETSSIPSSSGPRFRLASYTQIAAEMSDPENAEYEHNPQPALAPEPLPSEAPCPMRCGKILPRLLLDELNPNAGIRQQQAFCRRHQIADARETWKKEGYPEVDWSGLRMRLKGNEDQIARMIHQPARLHFRKAQEDRIRRGNHRNLKKLLEREGLHGLGVGYYGPRGLEAIMDYLSSRWSEVLSKLAVNDVVVAKTTPPAYMQMVLAPEIASLWVAEDMRVQPRRARAILEASHTVGELLCPCEDAERRPGRRVEVDD